MVNKNLYDVIIIGGSYAGLSAAMALGRSMRKVLIIDSGKPCNRQTPHSHNFITNDGETPAAIAQKAREQVLKYPTVQVITDTAHTGNKTASGFEISTTTGDTFNTRKIIFATGVLDIMPGIKGFAECWGITVLHCPYCHGYEVKDKTLGIIANGDMAFEMCKLIHHWSKKLTLFCNGRATLNDEQSQQLKYRQIEIVENEIEELVHNNGYVEQIAFKDGSFQNVAAIYSKVAFEQSSKMPASLGCAMSEQGFIQIDALQKTTISGVYSAGDCTTMMRSVAYAVGMGMVAGAMVNKELIDETF
ncbi:MAG: NAD(P)/FAD-dependent oxidoreductase [Ferruginibacter sp.]